MHSAPPLPPHHTPSWKELLGWGSPRCCQPWSWHCWRTSGYWGCHCSCQGCQLLWRYSWQEKKSKRIPVLDSPSWYTLLLQVHPKVVTWQHSLAITLLTLFPLTLSQILQEHAIPKFYLTINSGKWDYNCWRHPGNPGVGSGSELWVWMCNITELQQMRCHPLPLLSLCTLILTTPKHYWCPLKGAAKLALEAVLHSLSNMDMWHTNSPLTYSCPQATSCNLLCHHCPHTMRTPRAMQHSVPSTCALWWTWPICCLHFWAPPRTWMTSPWADIHPHIQLTLTHTLQSTSATSPTLSMVATTKWCPQQQPWGDNRAIHNHLLYKHQNTFLCFQFLFLAPLSALLLLRNDVWTLTLRLWLMLVSSN